jgi:ketosteroid isomerase-like protein
MNARNRIASLLLCLCLAAIPVFAQNPSNDRANADRAEVIEKEVLRLEEVGRQKVLKGDNNWDDLIAEDAYMIAFDGSIIIYKQGQQLPSMPVKSFKMSEMIARVYGEVVVVTGLAEVEGETPQKQSFSYKMRFLNVWKKFGGGWKIVVSERTGVRPPPK